MTEGAEITREQVEDFNARERGYKSAHDERVAMAQSRVGVAQLEVEEAATELQAAEKCLKEAKAQFRRLKRKAQDV